MPTVRHPRSFPFCLESTSPAPDISYSTNTVSLAGAMYAYWVPRIFKVSIDLSPIENCEIGPPDTYDFYFGSDAQNESDLVCTRSWQYLGGPGWESAYFSLFYGPVTPNIYGAISGGDSYRVFGDGVFCRFCEGSGDGVSIGYTLGVSGLPTTGSVDVKAGPYSFTYPISIATDIPPFDPCFYYEKITSIRIEAISYWGYEGTYDTETGLPL